MNQDEINHAIMCRNLTSEQLEALPLRLWERWLMLKFRIWLWTKKPARQTLQFSDGSEIALQPGDLPCLNPDHETHRKR